VDQEGLFYDEIAQVTWSRWEDLAWWK